MLLNGIQITIMRAYVNCSVGYGWGRSNLVFGDDVPKLFTGGGIQSIQPAIFTAYIDGGVYHRG